MFLQVYVKSTTTLKYSFMQFSLMVSPLVNAIDFLKEFGLFDVVLPFLLVFAIVFALLEKTRILGVEKIKGEEIPKKNLNATVAFVVALLVVSTNKIVTALNEALPNVVLLLVVIVSFLVLVGTFYKEGEFDFSKNEGWVAFFIFLSFVVILVIFAASIKVASGKSWLDVGLLWLAENISGPVVTTIIFVILAVLGVWLVAFRKPGEKKP